MLRYAADIRALAYMAFTTWLLVFNWQQDSLVWPTFLLACFMAVTVTVMSHNFKHLPMWHSKILNAITEYWLTLFYGYPVFAWIPTHNVNHHRFTNREGDYTITYRYSEANNLLTLLTYPSISSYHQQKPIRDYLKRLWATRKPRFWYCVSQYVVLGAFYAVTLWADWQKALLYVIIPHQIGLFFVLVFNYVQHVHADEESEFNHSRNITGPLLNILLFNNGYHTAHHLKPGTHWSLLPEEHANIAHRIDPSLNEPSFWWMIVRIYVLGLFLPRFRSHSMRLDRLDRERSARGMSGRPAVEAA